jgi:hypothetical protein
MGPSVISHWTTEAKNIRSPAIAAALILPMIKMIFRENPAKIPVWEKIR